MRPHHAFGTVELRICDAQTRGDESFALAGLVTACIAQAALDYDSGTLPEPLGQRQIEENLWRAIRWGHSGTQIDFATGAVITTREALERLLEWSTPARSALGIEAELPERNGTERARAAFTEGASLRDVYAASIADTRRTYAADLEPA